MNEINLTPIELELLRTAGKELEQAQLASQVVTSTVVRIALSRSESDPKTSWVLDLVNGKLIGTPPESTD